MCEYNYTKQWIECPAATMSQSTFRLAKYLAVRYIITMVKRSSSISNESKSGTRSRKKTMLQLRQLTPVWEINILNLYERIQCFTVALLHIVDDHELDFAPRRVWEVGLILLLQRVLNSMYSSLIAIKQCHLITKVNLKYRCVKHFTETACAMKYLCL